jgi:hypothetical protein
MIFPEEPAINAGPVEIISEPEPELYDPYAVSGFKR